MNELDRKDRIYRELEAIPTVFLIAMRDAAKNAVARATTGAHRVALCRLVNVFDLALGNYPSD